MLSFYKNSRNRNTGFLIEQCVFITVINKLFFFENEHPIACRKNAYRLPVANL